jgi:predicted acetyltransferase
MEYRPIRDVDELVKIAKQAYTLRATEREAVGPWVRDVIERGAEPYGAYNGGHLLAGYVLYDYRMRFRSSVVTMGGIGLVCSALAARGRGAVRLLLEKSVETMRDRGHAVSVLSPFDRSFYRKYGWESFSRFQRLELAPGQLWVPPAEAEYDVEELESPDAVSREFYNRMASMQYNLAQRGDAEWSGRTELRPWHEDTATRGVVKVTRDGEIVGLAGHAVWREPKGDSTITVDPFLYADEGAKREILRFLGRLSHQIKTVRFDIPEDLELWPYIVDCPTSRKLIDAFMVRVVSLASLDGLRLESPDVEVVVDVGDGQAPWNHGVWTLRVKDGQLRVASGGRPEVRSGIGALSSVLSGFTTFETLIAAGRMETLTAYRGQDLPRVTTFLADYF